MNNFSSPGDPNNRQDAIVALARWLEQILKIPPGTKKPATAHEGDMQLELQLGSDYHLPFYRQLPDFVMALLTNDATATQRYAPLLYHLAGCRECHHAYTHLYDSMRAALYPQGVRPLLGQGTRTLSATPHRMIGHLCETLISQAEAVLLQARHEHRDDDASARSLLQLALRFSASITQGSIRRSALHDLVRVATLFEGPDTPKQADPHLHSYTPTFAGAGARRGRKIFRRADMLSRHANQEQPVIPLQYQSLEGSIIQHGKTLELQLQDLGESLRGHHVQISIPLGPLLEPVRWLGGNPRAIRSTTRVDETGTLTTPLGETELELSRPEDRNLLEAIFLLLEVRRADQEG
jgi:hypothetical protein